MNRLTHVCKAGLAAFVLMAAVVACGGSDEASRDRNSLNVQGTSCAKPGQTLKSTVVCAKTNTGRIWYPIMNSKGRSVECAKPGTLRKRKSVVWVCGVAKGKTLWRATAPLPVVFVLGNAVAGAGGSAPAPVLESTDSGKPVVADSGVLADPAVSDQPLLTTTSSVPAATTSTVATTVPAATTSTVASTNPVKTSSTVASTTSVITTSTVVSVSYKIGSRGPGGGIVFYDAGSQQPWGRYLEAAPANWDGTKDSQDPYVQWGCNGKSIETSTAIGAGAANTTAIIEACKTVNAAYTARAYNGGDKTDWYLPSRDELEQLKVQAPILGFGGTTYHWSSSQYSLEEAHSRCVVPGHCNGATLTVYWKNFGDQVRPIRAIR